MLLESDVVGEIRQQLEWRDRGGRSRPHVTIPREEASVLLALIEDATTEIVEGAGDAKPRRYGSRALLTRALRTGRVQKLAPVLAANAQAWALGKQQRNGFHVRRVVWGKLMARTERREGEDIRRAVIRVGGKHSR